MPPAGSPCAPSSGIVALMRRSFVSTEPTSSSALSCSMHGAGCQPKLASQRSRGGCHTQRIPIIARHRDRHSVGRHMTARSMKPKPKCPSPPLLVATEPHKRDEPTAYLPAGETRTTNVTPPSAPNPAHDKILADMTRLAPLVERTDDSSHQRSCVDRSYEPDDIEAALRRQPAQTRPSARQESPPLSSGRPLAGRARSRPRRLRQARAPNRLGVRPGLSVGRYLRPGEAVRVAVRVHRREIVPDVAGVVSPRRGTSLRWSQPEALSGLPSLCVTTSFHGRALPRPHAMLSGERRWPSRRWVLSTLCIPRLADAVEASTSRWETASWAAASNRRKAVLG
jgi:hypothetical protein